MNSKGLILLAGKCTPLRPFILAAMDLELLACLKILTKQTKRCMSALSGIFPHVIRNGPATLKLSGWGAKPSSKNGPMAMRGLKSPRMLYFATLRFSH